MKQKVAIITGALGGIGQALCDVFKSESYVIVGININVTHDIPSCDYSLDLDLNRFSFDTTYRERMKQILNEYGDSLKVLVNNAAVQILEDSRNIKKESWEETFAVNLTAPMLLSQWAIPFLTETHGSIINIASIHQGLTKPRFVSYATSKSALVGLTKAMAVDLEGDVRVNCISPAAIETDMLRAGFENNESAIDELRKIHPIKRIGYPHEVAKVASFLAGDEAKFINGANLQLDGGISSVLHDL